MSPDEAVADPSCVSAFWEKVDKSDAEGCWPWTARADKWGRGRWKVNGRNMIASRAALLFSKGPPLQGALEAMHACHTCDNPPCCKPDHLFWGTREQNMQDMARKGRAGMQLHPERYSKPRRSDVRYRPVKQPDAPRGIDRRTWTRIATEHEKALAGRALQELSTDRNRIALVPAPQQSFPSHKIRVIESRNPQWYIDFGKRYWKNERQFDLKRFRVERALGRVLAGRVRGNGYEQELLVFLAEQWPEMRP